MTVVQPLRRYDRRRWTIDPRGCGGCTIHEFERMQVRAELLFASLSTPTDGEKR